MRSSARNIEISGCNSTVGRFWLNISKNPQVYSQEWPWNTPTQKAGVFHVSMFFFLFAFFCHSFSSLPLLLGIFRPENGPPNGVRGKFLVSWKTVPTVPVPGSNSVPEPPWQPSLRQPTFVCVSSIQDDRKRGVEFRGGGLLGGFGGSGGSAEGHPALLLQVPQNTGQTLSFFSLFFFCGNCEDLFSWVFSLFSRDFRGSVRIENPCFFFWGFPCVLPNNKERKDREEATVMVLAVMAVSVVTATPLKLGENSRGNTIRGNRTESLWEGNLPLRGSLSQRFLEGFRRFRGFQRFVRGFQRWPSQRQISLSEALSPVAPNRVAP